MPATRCWRRSNGWNDSTTKPWTTALWSCNRSKPTRRSSCQRIRMWALAGRWASATSSSAKAHASSWRRWERKRVTKRPWPSSRRGADGTFAVAGPQSNASSSFEWAATPIIPQCRSTMRPVYKITRSLVAPHTSILIVASLFTFFVWLIDWFFNFLNSIYDR